jgi:U2 small nuclear ribonucleoprotein A'
LIENIHGLKKFKFLDTLLLGNNSLRNLDKFLLELTKFAFMKQLDLFGNPLAEEPDYRLKLVYLMPQLNTIDRHVVTVAERIKAKHVCEEEYGL